MVKDFQVYASAVDVLNVYWYEQTDDDGVAGDLAVAFQQFVEDYVCYVQSEIVGHVRLGVYNTNNPLDWYEITPAGVAGTRGGDCLPPFVNWQFRLNRANREVRNGQKRICGVPESDQVNGIMTGNVSVVLTNLAEAMEAPLFLNPGDYQWTPRIVRRIPPIIPGGPWTYLPFPLASVQYVAITSQNSRKYNL
jgi:hypothetical protein